MTLNPEPRVEIAPDFPVLDSLRAIGALAVLTTHVSFQSGAYVQNGIWGALLSRLDVGVAIFFVLSGFLLGRPYLARRTADLPHPATGRYYWKRVLRVYPVYAVTVVLSLTLIAENQDVAVAEWVRSLTLTDMYLTGALPQGLTQMWSLAVEVAFYAVLPFLMLVAIGRSAALRPLRVTALLVAMVALSCWWHLSLAGTVDQQASGSATQWLPAYLSWFAVGLGLALANVLSQARTRPPRVSGYLESLAASPGVCWTLILGLMLVAATPVAGPTLLYVGTDAQALTKHLLYAAIGGLVVLTGIGAAPAGRYYRVMAARLPRRVGHTSYSLFCIHLPILYFVMKVTDYPLFGGHSWQIWSITVVLSLAISEVLYRLIERPALRLRNLTLRNPRRRGSTKPPTTRPKAASTR